MAVTDTRLQREAFSLLDRALSTSSSDEIVRHIFHAFDRLVGFDTGIIASASGSQSFTFGKPARQVDHWKRRSAAYRPEIARLAAAARRSRGVVNDREVLSAADRDKGPLYAEYLRPNGVRCTMALFVPVGDAYPYILALGRSSEGALFSPRESELVHALYPVAALLTRLAFGGAPRELPEATLASLGAREVEVCQLVSRGLRNAEIAAACGTSVNTVRNQLASIFKKLEVTTRAELAARVAAKDDCLNAQP